VNEAKIYDPRCCIALNIDIFIDRSTIMHLVDGGKTRPDVTFRSAVSSKQTFCCLAAGAINSTMGAPCIASSALSQPLLRCSTIVSMYPVLYRTPQTQERYPYLRGGSCAIQLIATG
jgi:hypothetical protein